MIGIDCHNMKRGEVTTCSNFTNMPHAIVEQLLTSQILTAESWPKIPTLLRHTSGMLCYHLNLGASIDSSLDCFHRRYE